MNNFLKALIKCFSIGLLLTILILEISFFIATHYNFNQTTILFTIGLFTLIFAIHLLINPEKETRPNLNSLFHPTLILIEEKNTKAIYNFNCKNNFIFTEKLNNISVILSSTLLIIISFII